MAWFKKAASAVNTHYDVATELTPPTWLQLPIHPLQSAGMCTAAQVKAARAQAAM